MEALVALSASVSLIVTVGTMVLAAVGAERSPESEG